MSARLAAALRRRAHEVECRRGRVVRADTYERLTADADRLLDRADVTNLPCITIRQPWARVVASGDKTVENRGRPTSHRGLVGIHAAKAHDPAGDTDPRIVGVWGAEPRVGQPVGAVIAVAELTDCHEAERPANRILVADGSTCCSPWGDRDYRNKPAWHLVLANVRRLERPVYARGSLALPWRLPEAETAQVFAQLGQEAG